MDPIKFAKLKKAHNQHLAARPPQPPAAQPVQHVVPAYKPSKRPPLINQEPDVSPEKHLASFSLDELDAVSAAAAALPDAEREAVEKLLRIAWNYIHVNCAEQLSLF